MRSRPRVIVAGTKFGRVYLAAVGRPGLDFELAGVLARGSPRSIACAEHYRVPLFTDPSQVPADVDIACVVVGSGLNGGPGRELAEALMCRGIHVLQEHPLHHDELVQCVRQAQRHGVMYRLNTHYIHVKPVRLFLSAAQAVLRRQRALFLDAACAFQTAYTLLDIVGRAFAGLRPWTFGPVAGGPQNAAPYNPPFRSLDGMIAGIPASIRVQNQVEPSEPDNYTHFFHRICIGFEGGNLTLLNTHGPVIWCPRPHMPQNDVTACLQELAGAHLDYATAAPIGPAEAPSFREILADLWPEAVREALRDFRDGIERCEGTAASVQYHLALSLVWQDLMSRFGSVQLLEKEPPAVLSAGELLQEIGSAGAALNASTRGSQP